MTILMLVNETIGSDLKKQLQLGQRAFDVILQTMDVAEAMEILASRAIDVLLCDAELFGNRDFDAGRRLQAFLQYVEDRSRLSVTIMISNRGSVDFVKKMTTSGVFEVLQKPVESLSLYEAVIRALMHRIADIRRLRLHRLPEEKQFDAEQRFWVQLLRGNIGSDYSTIDEYIQTRQLSIPIDSTYQPLLISFWNSTDHSTPKQHNRSTLIPLIQEKLAASEAFSHLYCVTIELSDDALLILLTLPEHPDISYRTLLPSQCMSLLKDIPILDNRKYRLLSGSPCPIIRLSETTEQLLFAQYYDKRDLPYIDIDSIHQNSPNFFSDAERRTAIEWRRLITGGSLTRARDMITAHLLTRKRQTKCSPQYLAWFNLSYMSIILDYMNRHALSPELLYNHASYVRCASIALFSFDAAIKWVHISIDFLRKSSVAGENSPDPVTRTLTYIKHHINQPIRMEELAQNVHLHPDYLNRIFKKSTNMSIRDYITQERIETAKWYLTHTAQSGTTIAKLVGYQNYSGFYRAFTNTTGMPPQDWKASHVSDCE